jgi:hypothetical protein
MGTSNEKEINNIIKIYHGFTYFFETIDVAKGKPYKDFGRGFYVTHRQSHVESLAKRNRQIESKKGNINCQAYLYTFDFDESNISKFKTKIFKQADIEWLKFVIANRKVRERNHNFDIVMGPTADDETMAVINVYLEGMYGYIGSDDALDILLKFIKPDVLPYQICFSTNAAAVLLTKKEEVKII